MSSRKVAPHNVDQNVANGIKVSTTAQPPGDEGLNTVTREDGVEVERRVGPVTGVSIIVGTMIGTGIFISPTGVAAGTGSVGLMLVVWGLCGVISLIGAFCYAELGTTYSESGGMYNYLNKGLGPIPAFLHAWMTTIANRYIFLSISTISCATYITAPIFYTDGCGGAPDYIVKMLAVIILMLLTALNYWNTKLASRVHIFFTVAKVLCLTVILVMGIVKLAQGNTQYLDEGFKGSEQNVGKVVVAIYNGMYSFVGWSSLNIVVEEVIDPKKNIPKCILISLPVVTGIYILVICSYMSVMSIGEMLTSSAVAATWSAKVFPQAGWLVPAMVAICAFGSVNGQIFLDARSAFAQGRNGHSLAILAMVDSTGTPVAAITLGCILGIVFIIPSNIGSLISFLGFATWMFEALIMIGMIRNRFIHKDLKRPFKVPIALPILFLAIALFFLIAPIATNPRIEFLYSFLFIVAGFIIYIPCVHFKKTLPCMKYITTFFQLLLRVSPTTESRNE